MKMRKSVCMAFTRQNVDAIPSSSDEIWLHFLIMILWHSCNTFPMTYSTRKDGMPSEMKRTIFPFAKIICFLKEKIESKSTCSHRQKASESQWYDKKAKIKSEKWMKRWKEKSFQRNHWIKTEAHIFFSHSSLSFSVPYLHLWRFFMAVEKRKKKRTTNYFIILGKIHSMRSDFMLIALVSVFIIFHLRRRRLFWILRLFSRRAHGSNENFKLNLLLGLHTALNLRIHFEMMAHPLSIWDQKGKYAEWNRQTDGGILLQTSVRQKSTGTFFILFFFPFSILDARSRTHFSNQTRQNSYANT